MTDSLLLQGKAAEWRLNEELNAATIKNADKAIRTDESSATITYVGVAVVGAATNAAIWQIKRITNSGGIVIEWADGNNLFDNIWDNRGSLTYS